MNWTDDLDKLIDALTPGEKDTIDFIRSNLARRFKFATASMEWDDLVSHADRTVCAAFLLGYNAAKKENK